MRAHKGVRLLGDLPFYVSPDSSDVWAAPQFFRLDEHRRPLFVAGVPPDYFSATGQLWGNPVYDWQALQRERLPLVDRAAARAARRMSTWSAWITSALSPRPGAYLPGR